MNVVNKQRLKYGNIPSENCYYISKYVQYLRIYKREIHFVLNISKRNMEHNMYWEDSDVGV